MDRQRQIPINSADSISWSVGEIFLAKPARLLRKVSTRCGIFWPTILPSCLSIVAFTENDP